MGNTEGSNLTYDEVQGECQGVQLPLPGVACGTEMRFPTASITPEWSGLAAEAAMDLHSGLVRIRIRIRIRVRVRVGSGSVSTTDRMERNFEPTR